MSVIGHLRLIPGSAWALGLGLTLNSAILFGNAGVDLVGAVPIVTEKLGKSDLKPKDKVRLWSLFYKAAATYVVSGIVLSASSHLLAAYLTPSRRVRNASLIAAVASASIMPYTLFLILPTNKTLLAMDKKVTLTPAEEKDVPFYIAKWKKLHSLRYVQYTIGWAAGLGALMGVVGKW